MPKGKSKKSQSKNTNTNSAKSANTTNKNRKANKNSANKTVSANEPRVEPRVVAPVSVKDERYLGKGRSKMIWLYASNKERNQLKEPRLDRVVVNAFNQQLLEDSENTDTLFLEKRTEQENEFRFTELMHFVFPELIPNVYPITMEIDPQPRFRYEKDRCYPITKNKHLFSLMIEISDIILDQGWVYLDMKHGNLGQMNGSAYLLDTDPYSFYRIPRYADKELNRRIDEFYKVSCDMIILLICMNFVPEVPRKTLQDYIRKKKYTYDLFREIYNRPPPSVDDIAAFNNQGFIQDNYPDIHISPDKIMAPNIFIRTYGIYTVKGFTVEPLDRLKEIIEFTN